MMFSPRFLHGRKSLLLTLCLAASLTASARQLERLSFARSELACACAESTTDLALSLVSSALGALSELTGREFSEELLDSIFSRFCVGK